MLKRIGVAALLASLSGCAVVPAAVQVAVGGAAVARSAYCVGTTEEAKQALRDWASAGEQFINCQAPEE